MTFRPAISADVRAAVLADYVAGEKTAVIEMQYGLKRGHARMIAARAGLPPRPLYSRKPGASRHDDCRKMILNGEVSIGPLRAP